MEFSFQAKNQQGKISQGKIQADSEKKAIEALKNQGLFVLNLATPHREIPTAISFRRKISLKDKIIFTKELAMMVRGGLSLVEALTALEEQTENQNFKEIIRKIADDVRGGMALSKAFAKSPKIFPNIYVAVTASGEKSGKLDQVLDRLADQLQKDYDLINKIKSAITYPIVVVCALMSVIIIMLIFVIPKLKDIFSEMGVALPITTRALLGLSDFTVRFWYIVIVLIVAIYFGIKYWSKTLRGGLAWDTFKIRVPIFGKLVQKIYMARFTRTMATLVASGLPMLDILMTVREVIGNKIYSAACDSISKDVENGVTLSVSLKKHRIFPPMITQMVFVGEKSGRVDDVFFNLADFYDKEVATTTASLTSLIEPILILIIGAGVGLAIASVIMPIYSLVNVI